MSRPRNKGWTLPHVLLLTAACMIAGVAAGWLIRMEKAGGFSVPTPVTAAQTAGAVQAQGASAATQATADAAAAPLLAQLQSDPKNPELLAGIGNIYYDAQRYAEAVGYYGRALRIRPSDAAVRTDMGTATWYMGNADAAITEFNRALIDQPGNPNALFNRGVVKWQGKMDTAGALADWKQLLAKNPNYAERAKVEQLMAEVAAHPGTPGQ